MHVLECRINRTRTRMSADDLISSPQTTHPPVGAVAVFPMALAQPSAAGASGGEEQQRLLEPFGEPLGAHQQQHMLCINSSSI